MESDILIPFDKQSLFMRYNFNKQGDMGNERLLYKAYKKVGGTGRTVSKRSIRNSEKNWNKAGTDTTKSKVS